MHTYARHTYVTSLSQLGSSEPRSKSKASSANARRAGPGFASQKRKLQSVTLEKRGDCWASKDVFRGREVKKVPDLNKIGRVWVWKTTFDCRRISYGEKGAHVKTIISGSFKNLLAELIQKQRCFMKHALLFGRGCLPEPSFFQKLRPFRKLGFPLEGLIKGSNFSFFPKLPLTGPSGQQSEADS